MRPNTKLILSVAICSLAAFWGTVLLGQDATSRDSEALQMEKGRSVIANVCVACHTNILRVVQDKKSPVQWKDTVYSMIGRGAQVTPDEIDAVTLFLSASARNGRGGQEAIENSGRASGSRQNQSSGGDARGILERSCQQCHDLATASAKPASENWTAVITKMVNYGARLSPADKQKLIDYFNLVEK